MTTNDGEPSFFARFIDSPAEKERLAAEAIESEQGKSQLIERLLSWLVNNWAKSTITAWQIKHYGPYPLRNETKATLDLAQELVERGWLIPFKPARHDMRKWKIGPNRAE
jgi:hypothetical protein